jgi:hypothetical protein
VEAEGTWYGILLQGLSASTVWVGVVAFVEGPWEVESEDTARTTAPTTTSATTAKITPFFTRMDSLHLGRPWPLGELGRSSWVEGARLQLRACRYNRVMVTVRGAVVVAPTVLPVTDVSLEVLVVDGRR